jgi:hypothetical protein
VDDDELLNRTLNVWTVSPARISTTSAPIPLPLAVLADHPGVPIELGQLRRKRPRDLGE